VDAAVAGMLSRERHYAWTAYQAGLAKASDDDIAVHAYEQGAALISHDGVSLTSEFAIPSVSTCGWTVRIPMRSR
jgi:hypothetical protein